MIDQAVAYIHDQEGIYADTDSVKTNKKCKKCRFALWDADGCACTLGNNKYASVCAFFEEVEK